MKPLAWSHSALQDYLNCPKQFYHKRVAKDIKETPNPAGEWGDYVHKEFEKYLKSKGRYKLPENVAHYQGYLQQILDRPGELFTERKYALNRKLQPCDFFAKDEQGQSLVWSRAIIDVLILGDGQATIIDHKTGKVKNDNTQLKLCALFVFCHHPEINVVDTKYGWLQERRFASGGVYIRTDFEQLWDSFLQPLQAYLESFRTVTFNPKPSGLCNGWCPVEECEYWKPKRGSKAA